MRVSIVITTYNWPEALSAVLDTVAKQNQLPHEVIIADDGSGDATKSVIEQHTTGFPCPIVHVWHEDNGYQVAKIRNQAVATATGDYLIFIDGDCLLRSDFVASHISLSRPNSFISGNRVLLSESYTNEILTSSINLSSIKAFDLHKDQTNRRWSLLPIPLGPLRRLHPKTWKGVKACNMSVHTRDFVKTNGYDDDYEGWGYEDSDLIVRLLNNDVHRIGGRFATTVLHLWHGSNKSFLEQGNWERLQKTISDKRKKAVNGINKYL